MNLACSGLAVGARKEEWLKLAGKDERLQKGLGQLYDLFKDAPTLGSLIDPKQGLAGDLFQAEWAELQPLLKAALEREEVKKDCFAQEVGIAAQGMAKAAEVMSANYHLVTTNVPYLSRGQQAKLLKDFCEHKYPKAKNDLATCFLEKCIEFSLKKNTISIVVLKNWLLLSRYKYFRETMLRSYSLLTLTKLGPGAFESISGEVVNVVLVIISHEKTTKNNIFYGLNLANYLSYNDKIINLTNEKITSLSQYDQLNNPDSRILLEKQLAEIHLKEIADSRYGLRTGDLPRMARFIWELLTINKNWRFLQGTVKSCILYNGRERVLLWQDGEGELKKLAEAGIASIQGGDAWGKQGIAVSLMSNLPCTIYTGDIFDNGTGVIWPFQPDNLPPVFSFCVTSEFNVNVRKIDSSIKVTNQTLLKIPFDLEHWQKVAAEQYPNGLPAPFSDDPTQWIFHGHPAQSEQPLQVAVARLLGYRWPAELDQVMELADFQRELVQKCDTLLSLSDGDGIVSLPAVRGARPAEERLRKILMAAYGTEWSEARLSEILTTAGYAGKTLEAWLRDGFFKEHCQVFHQRPFIWHIWDGRKDGFAALVNYHKLDRKNLETLTYTYLGDWLQRQADGVKQKAAGAEERRWAAQALQDKLKLILAGENPYDIFVRWKPLEQQPLGWEPDLNDGVRLNIRPFMTADILRHRPKINWNKDRGKDVASAPWYHIFEGERINDHHLKFAVKKAAREDSKSPATPA